MAKKVKSEMIGIKSYQKDFTVTEMKTLPNGDLQVKGPIMEVGVRLGNGTVYSEDVWKNTIEGYNPYIEKRMAYGMMDHPERKGPKGKEADLSTKLERTYGICTKLEFSQDKKMIIGTFEIYRDESNLVGRKLSKS